jgi:hypothetical protein
MTAHKLRRKTCNQVKNICILLSSMATVILFLKALRVSALFTYYHQVIQIHNSKHKYVQAQIRHICELASLL